MNDKSLVKQIIAEVEKPVETLLQPVEAVTVVFVDPDEPCGGKCRHPKKFHNVHFASVPALGCCRADCTCMEYVATLIVKA